MVGFKSVGSGYESAIFRHSARRKSVRVRPLFLAMLVKSACRVSVVAGTLMSGLDVLCCAMISDF